MDVPGKLFGRLSAAVILTYMAVVAIGFFMPLQSDEISGLYLNHRAILDGKTVINLIPQCGLAAFSNPLPLIWYLPAYASYLTYGQIDNPLWLRIAGIGQFLIWLALWLAVAMKLFAVPAKRWWMALAVILAFLGLDAVPLVLIVDRPEQTLLIGSGTAAVMALYAGEIGRRRWLAALATFWMLFTVMYMHAAHPKSAGLLPLELVMYGVFLQRAWKSRVLTAIGLMAVAWIGLESYMVTLLRIQCPGAPEVTEFFAGAYLQVQDLWRAPLHFVLAVLKNVIASSLADFYLDIYFRVSHIWIPLSLHPLGAVTDFTIRALDFAGWLVHFLPLVLAGWVCVAFGLPRLRGRRAAQENPLLLPALAAMLAFIGALFVLISEGVYYSVTLMIPFVLLAGMFAVRLKYPEPWKHNAFAKLALAVFAGAILNQALLFDRYAGFASATDAQSYAALNINHKALSPLFGHEQRESDILALAEECHIGTGADVKHLSLDDETYHVFRKTYQPWFFQDSTWLCCHKKAKGPGKGDAAWFNLGNYLKLLRAYDSDGVIAQCKIYPDTLRPFAKERAGFCCIPKSAIPYPPSR